MIVGDPLDFELVGRYIQISKYDVGSCWCNGTKGENSTTFYDFDVGLASKAPSAVSHNTSKSV